MFTVARPPPLLTLMMTNFLPSLSPTPTDLIDKSDLDETFLESGRRYLLETLVHPVSELMRPNDRLVSVLFEENQESIYIG